MKPHESFRDGGLAGRIGAKIGEIAKDLPETRIMHVCGTHEDTIGKYGIRTILPPSVEVIPGPGCPVCVSTAREIDEAIELSRRGITVTSFGDMLKVPGTNGTLADAKSEGCDVRVVYSISDSLRFAKESEGDVVHVGIGFETTAPSTAAAVIDAPANFSVLCCHRLIPPAINFLMESGDVKVDGFIDPGHVLAITGLSEYRNISDRYGIPQVVSGFEPVDVLAAILLLLEMLRDGRKEIVNEYSRVVREEGNMMAQELMGRVFEVSDVKWRGFPVIPCSGLSLRKEYEAFDARKRYGLRIKDTDEPRGCRCGDVLKGLIKPVDCPLYGKACTPENAVGPCMVSGEGSCRISYRYGGKP